MPSARSSSRWALPDRPQEPPLGRDRGYTSARGHRGRDAAPGEAREGANSSQARQRTGNRGKLTEAEDRGSRPGTSTKPDEPEQKGAQRQQTGKGPRTRPGAGTHPRGAPSQQKGRRTGALGRSAGPGGSSRAGRGRKQGLILGGRSTGANRPSSAGHTLCWADVARDGVEAAGGDSGGGGRP